MTRIILAAVGVILLCSSAQAHGEADWIMDSPATSYCCGPQDCAPVEPARVSQDAKGLWLLDGMPVDPKNVHPARHQHPYWACFYTGGEKIGKPRCLFIPFVF